MPAISVIIPVYNTERYLAQCLDSVLAQTLTDIEVICIDDGSTDKSPEILAEYAARDKRIKPLHQKNAGVVAARNNAVAHATAELIYPLDSDDIIAPNTLEKLYDAFVNKRGDIITCRVMQFGDKNTELPLRKPNRFNMAFDNCLVNAALFRKCDFERAGGYSEKFNLALEDYDLWLRLMFQHNMRIYRVPEILFFYRIKEKHESRNEAHRDEHIALMQKIYEQYPALMRIRMRHERWAPMRKIARFVFRIQDGYIKIFKIPIWHIKKYDTVISIGAACFVPQAMKQLNLRDFSGPFDWMFGADVITRLNLVLNEFRDYFNADDMEYVGQNPDNGKLVYKNTRTGLVYNHDFPVGEFGNTYPVVADKYLRRTKRTLEYLGGDNRVLLVFAEFGQTGDRQRIIEIMDKINDHFHADIDLLYINHNPKLKPGRFVGLRRISPHVIYGEYFYKHFPAETNVARRTLKRILKKVAK